MPLNSPPDAVQVGRLTMTPQAFEDRLDWLIRYADTMRADATTSPEARYYATLASEGRRQQRAFRAEMRKRGIHIRTTHDPNGGKPA